MSRVSPTVETRLTATVLLFSIVFGVLFSAVQLWLDHRTEQQQFRQQLEQALEQNNDALALALSQYHSEAIQAIFHGLMSIDGVVGVQVEDDVSGYQQHRGIYTSDTGSHGLRVLEHTLSRTDAGLSRSGDGGAKVIGIASVWFDPDAAYGGFQQRALVTTAIELARVVVLALILILALRKTMVKPLQALAARLRQLEPETAMVEPIESPARYHEFEELVSKINELFGSFDVEMQRRRQAEKRARHLNDKLEEKVRARTRELKASNSQLQQSLDELQRTQKLLLQAQRMASLGHLAAGIAHEINNPVAVVYSNIATLSEYLTELIELAEQLQQVESSIADAAIRHSLATMRRSIDLDFVKSDAPDLVRTSQGSLERVRNIVTELKTFVLQEGQAKRSVDLTDLMQQAIAELRLEDDERILLDVQMIGIPRVDCVAGQVRLAFRHILDNARDAIETDGRIEIAATQVEDKVEVVIRDNGMGMDREVLSCAIDPFYTRKEIGKGTGLGLTVAFNVMINHGGSLDISSEPGVGTTVTFCLPIVDASQS